MATYRSLINRALIGLGHADDLVADGATELTDAYHIKVAEWMNDVLEEVEAAAQWRVLRQRDTATVTAGELSATLTNSNERSRVFQVLDARAGRLIPLAFDVTDSTNQKQLRELDFSTLLYRDQMNSNQANGAQGPEFFALNATATGMEVYVWPRSTSAISLELDMIIPQSRLDYTDEDDLNAAIKVPALPVVYGTTWWAMEDRGEEFGVNGEKNEVRYRRILADAVAGENAAQGFDELVPT